MEFNLKEKMADDRKALHVIMGIWFVVCVLVSVMGML